MSFYYNTFLVSMFFVFYFVGYNFSQLCLAGNNSSVSLLAAGSKKQSAENKFFPSVLFYICLVATFHHYILIKLIFWFEFSIRFLFLLFHIKIIYLFYNILEMKKYLHKRYFFMSLNVQNGVSLRVMSGFEHEPAIPRLPVRYHI